MTKKSNAVELASADIGARPLVLNCKRKMNKI